MTESSAIKKKQTPITTVPLLHGGNVQAAAEKFAIAESEWVDLSTGVNPSFYPIPQIPAEAFTQLPYVRTNFLAAAEAYYGSGHFIPVPGSQAAIQLLPKIINAQCPLPVLLPSLGYSEHLQHWREAGVKTVQYSALAAEDMARDIDRYLAGGGHHLVVIQPNNPTAVSVGKDKLLEWSAKLGKGAFLIIDEAFIDITPQPSLLSGSVLADNIIVLRSFGKFFGLAGLRLGFVFAQQAICEQISRGLGQWQINGPAQYVAESALRDTQWQVNARQEIAVNNKATEELFRPLLKVEGCTGVQNGGLFLSYFMPAQMATRLYQWLAEQGILVRVIGVCQSSAILRVGLVSRSDGLSLNRIEQAVALLPST